MAAFLVWSDWRSWIEPAANTHATKRVERALSGCGILFSWKTILKTNG